MTYLFYLKPFSLLDQLYQSWLSNGALAVQALEYNFISSKSTYDKETNFPIGYFKSQMQFLSIKNGI